MQAFIQSLTPQLQRFDEVFNEWLAYRSATEGMTWGLDHRFVERLLFHVEQLYQAIGREDLYRIFRADFDRWVESGVDQEPDFSNYARCYSSSGEGKVDFFIGPLRCPNSDLGNRFEWQYFVSLRDDPLISMEVLQPWRNYKAQPCQPSRLLQASQGVSKGNCLVFFPENIQALQKVESQGCALFFFNKFETFYKGLTVPNTRILSDYQPDVHYNSEDFYTARSLWGYLHDYFHHQGIRPLQDNLYLKLNWHCGVLEEIKVDAQTLLLCNQQRDLLPYATLVMEMILFERLFRYPFQADAERNFDAATGCFLYEWLKRDGAFDVDEQGRLHLEWPRLLISIEKMVAAIETVEAFEENDRFQAEARTLVERFLLPGENARFRLSDDQLVMRNKLQALKGTTESLAMRAGEGLRMVKIDYDGRRFHTLLNSGNGEVGEQTLFDYRQQGNLVTASYEGGEILCGHLIAKVLPDQRLDMRYHHLNRNGELKIGTCLSTPSYLEDGRLSLDEVWQWLCDDFSRGQSKIVELEALQAL
ncbi:DUF6421 family protein [Thiomicrorhabdus sp.]|uniref:DUF6421 family protein n=1 Tax=Thiomicrorhabdus sp. TaxID=2039724 RepID=UPI0029C7BD8A|nr:DUF6421 family protein [Thiomicrorhabdus sp.]